jgi:NADH-quinone oxidoreductase subunit M
MILFLLPFVLAIFAFFLPRKALLFLSLIPLIVLLFYPENFEIKIEWLSSLHLFLHLKMTALSHFFLLLTALIIPFVIFASHSNLQSSLIFLTQGLLFGFFMAEDLLLFTFFWEGMLLPLFFIIYLWGGPQKEKAAIQFLMYMLLGSFLMIAAVLGLFFMQHSFDISTLSPLNNAFLFFAFLLAFLVKTPMFPFHGWLPISYYEAPLSGTLLLAALLSKAGIYGILKIVLPLFPNLVLIWQPYLLALAIIGVLYGAVAAFRQNDFKKVIIYSSLSHVNFILAGLFVGNAIALEGALLQVFNHSITITGLFLVFFFLEKRISSTLISSTGGLTTFSPILAWTTFVFILASIALPATNNFVGELLIFFGLFKVSPLATFFLSLTTIFSVIYMLYLMQKVYFEEAKNTIFIKDLSFKEALIITPLIALIFFVGLYPTPLLEKIPTQGVLNERR